MKKALLLRSAIVAALGGLLFGFDTAVISGAELDVSAIGTIATEIRIDTRMNNSVLRGSATLSSNCPRPRPPCSARSI